MATDVGYRFAGDIEVKGLFLISQLGEVIDLSSIAIEVNIFQDLFKHYIEGEVVVSDGVSLLSTLGGDSGNGLQGGFNGGEVLAISYKSRDKSLDFKTHFFGVYNVRDRQRVDGLESYVLQCISAEAYQATGKKISRAYGGTGGNQISKMVSSIVSEYVYNRAILDIHRNYRETLGIRIEKEVNVDDTNGLHKYVIPNMEVDDAINFLSGEADCKGHVPFFTFYENSEGFNFRDISNLAQQEPKDKFYYLESNFEESKKDEESFIPDSKKIISFDVSKQTDILDNTKKGLYRSKTINIDMLKKKSHTSKFNYDNEYKKFSKLQNIKIPGDSSETSRVFMMTSRQGHDGEQFFREERPAPKRINQFIGRKKSYQRQLFNIVVEVTINGDSELDVGDVIELAIPNATNLDKLDGKKDKYLSGKYLITKLRHKFSGKSGSQFVTFMECTKDTGIEF